MEFVAALRKPTGTSGARPVMTMADGNAFGILCNWEQPPSLFFVPGNQNVSITAIEGVDSDLCVSLPWELARSDAKIDKFWELPKKNDEIIKKNDEIIIKVTYSVLAASEGPVVEVKLRPKLMDKFQVSIGRDAAQPDTRVVLPVFEEPAVTGKECVTTAGTSVGDIIRSFTRMTDAAKWFCICRIDKKDHGEMVRDILLWNNEITLVPNQLDVRVYKMRKNMEEGCYVVPVEYHTGTDTVLFVAPIKEEMTFRDLYEDMEGLKEINGMISVSLAGLNQTVRLDCDESGKVGDTLRRVVAEPMEKVTTGWKLEKRPALTIVVVVETKPLDSSVVIRM